MSKMISRHRQMRQGAEEAAGSDRGSTPESGQGEHLHTASKQAGAFKGRFVTLVQTPKNTLEMIPDPPAIAEFVADSITHLPTDILSRLHTPEADAELAEGKRRYNVWGDDEVLRKLLEDRLANGWRWVSPQEIGQLTSAPILESPDGRMYFHEAFQTQAAAEELLTGQKVKFDGAPENHAPVEKAEPMKAASEKPAAKAAADEPVPPAPGLAPAAPPAPMAPVSGGNPYAEWQTEALISSIEMLTDLDNFATAKPEQKAVEQMAEVLSARPVEQEQVDQTKKASLARAYTMLASVGKKKEGRGAPPVNTETGAVLEGDKSIPDGRDKVEDHTGIEKPKVDLPEKFAAGAPPTDQDTGAVLEGDKSVPDGKKEEEDHTGVEKPATETPEKVASGAPPTDQETAKVLEGDKSIPDSGSDVEDHTGVTKPATEAPSKFASEVTPAKALKLVESLIEDLQGIYIDSKPITQANDTRPVREGVEAIYHAMQALGEAQKVLAKQVRMESEEAAAQAVNKSKGIKASITCLKLAAVEPEVRMTAATTRRNFRDTVIGHVGKEITARISKEAAEEVVNGILRSASAMAHSKTASRQPRHQEKMIALAAQLGMTATFTDGTRIHFADSTSVEVPA